MVVNYNRKSRRKKRVSANIKGTEERPRISVFRSSKYVFAQAIDDVKRNTLASINSRVAAKAGTGTKTDESKAAGIELAEKLKKIKVAKAVYDRGPYAYNGRVKALAEGLREGGITI